jgi:hypothetical protein
MNISFQNYWGSGLCPSPGILNTRKHNILETGCVSVPHLRMDTDPVSEMLCFLVFRIPDDGHSPKTL